jgi:ATP-dependent DNA ligase
MVAFDLLYLNGHDLRKLPLIERKARLKKTLADQIRRGQGAPSGLQGPAGGFVTRSAP